MQTDITEQVRWLVERCVQQKDVRAFDELVRLHQSMLRYSLRQLTGWDEGLADDIAQETFLKAYQSIGSFHASAKFSTWLYRIAYNLFIDHSRRQKRSPVGDTEVSEDSIQSVDQHQDLHRDLARAMLMLTEQQRMALHLSLHRQCTQAEVADIMDCPLGTVKSHILRGKEKLQEVLADWREEISI